MSAASDTVGHAAEATIPLAWLEHLLDAALVNSTTEYLHALAELLLDELRSDVLVNWETFVVNLYRREVGALSLESGSDDAQALRSPQLYTMLNLGFTDAVRSFDTTMLAAAGFADHPALRHLTAPHACSIDIILLTGEVVATLVLYGESSQAAARTNILRLIRPYVSRTYLALRLRDRQCATGNGLNEFLRKMPVGLIMVDWFRKILSVNEEAQRQAIVWSEGSIRVSVKAAQARFTLPKQIEHAWQTLQINWIENLREHQPPPPPIVITHARNPSLKATVSLVQGTGSAGMPCLMTRFSSIYTRAADALFDPTPNQVSVLAKLSTAERSVALLVLQGMSNREVATRLGRQVSTVKDHLTSIYSKLGLRSRTLFIYHFNEV